jgi:hypothetical protein
VSLTGGRGMGREFILDGRTVRVRGVEPILVY